MEIPLLRESQTFADRLREAVRVIDESKYYRNRRINWSYRYCEAYYAAEAVHFCRSPAEYVKGELNSPPQISDVFSEPIRPRQLAGICLKVFAHWTFAIIGKLVGYRRSTGLDVYRKCYVDDIELAFDPLANGILRVVFPFPLSVGRQWRYCRHLQKQALPFRLDGNRYVLRDLIALLVTRNVRALMRLESRAEIRTARQVLMEGFSRIELSDEFNIGSLDFCRTLSRAGVPIINSAHGIGKYFPIHSYSQFNILNSKQKQYYKSERPCKYEYFKLYTTYGSQSGAEHARKLKNSKINIIFLSQVVDNGNWIIFSEERKLIEYITPILNDYKNVSLNFKPHPNASHVSYKGKWKIIYDLKEINQLDNRIFISFFSTCHIDDRFQGKKYLIRTELIHPEIAYDDNGDIFDIKGIEKIITKNGGVS